MINSIDIPTLQMKLQKALDKMTKCKEKHLNEKNILKKEKESLEAAIARMRPNDMA